MKKLISVLLITTIILGIFIGVSVSATDSGDVFLKDSVVQATVIMPSVDTVVGIEGNLTYSSSKLQYVNDSIIAPHISDMIFYNDNAGIIKFNASNIGTYDISSDHVVLSACFTVLENVTVNDFVSEIKDAYILDSNSNDYIDLSTNSLVDVKIFRNASEKPSESDETEPASSEHSTTTKTTVKLQANNTTIKIGSSTLVKAVIKNGKGNTVLSSSNSKVATVSASGKVKGLSAGTVNIYAKNNGITAKTKITVIKKTNPFNVKSKTVNAKSSKNMTFAKDKAFKLVKAKGKVVFVKKSGNKRIIVNAKTGKITVKKGLKKGKYKVKVNVTAKGDSTYAAKSKNVTVTVKVK